MNPTSRFNILNRLVTSIKLLRNHSTGNVLKLHERGFYADIFPPETANEIADLLNASSQTVYAGFDPTADSLHVGNLLVLINLLHWQNHGHNVIALIGGATAQVGDPSGRTKDRPEIRNVVVENNSRIIQKSIETIFSNYSKHFYKNLEFPKFEGKLKIVNNIDWYNDMSVLNFFTDVGKNFRLGQMLAKQFVKDRLPKGGMSYTEFSYQILQAYDWLYLFKNYGCRFQIGGSDQLGNIISGYDLILKFSDAPVYGITLPLVTTEEGDKYGKTAANAVWLSKEKTSAFQLYQFFLRVKDSDVQKLLKLFTFESMPKILEIMNEHWKAPHKRIAQKKLAENVLLLVHGEEGLAQAENASEALYEYSLDHLKKLEPADLITLFQGTAFKKMVFEPGTTVCEVAVRAGCFRTKHDAITIITSGGFYINHQRVKDHEEVISEAKHIMPNKISLMRVGKKNYTVVHWL